MSENEIAVELDPTPTTRLRWSTMMTWSVAGMAVSGVGLTTTCIASAHYTGEVRTNAVFWILAIGFGSSFVCVVGAHIRDYLAHRFDSRLNELEEKIAIYGDQREITGHVNATRATSFRAHGHLAPVLPIDE